MPSGTDCPLSDDALKRSLSTQRLGTRPESYACDLVWPIRQALVLITKWPRPHITTNPVYCFERTRDTISAGQLPHQCHVEHDKAEILRHAK